MLILLDMIRVWPFFGKQMVFRHRVSNSRQNHGRKELASEYVAELESAGQWPRNKKPPEFRGLLFGACYAVSIRPLAVNASLPLEDDIFY